MKFARVKRIAEMFIAEWQDKLLLDTWGFYVQRPRKEHVKHPAFTNAAATCAAEPVYKRAYISIYKGFDKALIEDDHDRRAVLLHEMVHVILGEYDQLVHDLRHNKGKTTEAEVNRVAEGTTQHIMRIVLKAYGLKESK